MERALRFERMRETLAAWGPLPDPAWARLAAVFAPAEAARGAFLALPDAPHQNVFFVAEGLLRVYYTSGTGRRELNKSFIAEGMFGGSLASCLTGVRRPCTWARRACCPC